MNLQIAYKAALGGFIALILFFSGSINAETMKSYIETIPTPQMEAAPNQDKVLYPVIVRESKQSYIAPIRPECGAPNMACDL